jgi:hypothetical protein
MERIEKRVFDIEIQYRLMRFALAAAMGIAAACGPARQRQSRLPESLYGEAFGEEAPARSHFDAQAAYLETDLDAYVSQVRLDPQKYSPEQVTEHVRSTLNDQNLSDYWPIMSVDLDAMGKLSGKDRPAFSNAHPGWLSQGPARWLIGQHLSGLGSKFSIPALKDLVKGTDLGISVSLGEKTLIYFGDTGGERSPDRCRHRTIFRCDDAIGVSFDAKLDDGMDLYLFTERRRFARGFVPLVIPGIHEFTKKPEPRFGTYSTPTGAAVVSGAPFWTEGPVVAVWYGTFSRPPEGETGVTASWVGCSPDGLHFESCYSSSGAPVAFSRGKFIQVSPIPVTREDISKVCANDDSGVICGLPEWRSSQGGMLLFGAGGRYRCSGLYMAYIPMEQFGSVHRTAGETVPFAYYFTGSGWSEEEEDARAVIAIDESRCGNVGTGKDPIWCNLDRNGRCGRRGGQENAFGEISAKLVRQGLKDDGVPFLVMLSNHMGWPVLYRTASLSHPERWSEPKLTENPGYGPYIIEKSIRVEDGRLILYHVISTWGGPRGKTPYGVYTQPLRIMVDGEPVPPPWPPGE